MNKPAKNILRKLVDDVAHHDENLWWELKRQIFNYGFDTHYPYEEEFRFPAEPLRA